MKNFYRFLSRNQTLQTIKPQWNYFILGNEVGEFSELKEMVYCSEDSSSETKAFRCNLYASSRHSSINAYQLYLNLSLQIDDHDRIKNALSKLDGDLVRSEEALGNNNEVLYEQDSSEQKYSKLAS